MIISDLTEFQDLVIYCQNQRCRRSVQLTRAEAIDRFGADLPLSTIRERARCAVCGSVGADTIVQYVGLTGAA